VDDVVAPLLTLHFACKHERFPTWAEEAFIQLKSGELLLAVKKIVR